MNGFRALAMGSGALLATGVAVAQSGNTMNGGTWGSGWMGGYGGGSMVLLLVVVVALVAWIAKRGGK